MDTVKRKFLVVDDQHFLAEVVAMNLHSLGYETVMASHGLEALGLIDAGLKPDVIITDVDMPLMSGPSFVEKLRSKNSTVPVIFMSGDNRERSQEELLVLSPHFLKKPFTRDQFLHKLSQVISLILVPAQAAS